MYSQLYYDDKFMISYLTNKIPFLDVYGDINLGTFRVRVRVRVRSP